MPPGGVAGSSGGADGQSPSASASSAGPSGPDGSRRIQRLQRPQRPARIERVVRIERVERIERIERVERPQRRSLPADVAAAERRTFELVQIGAQQRRRCSRRHRIRTGSGRITRLFRSSKVTISFIQLIYHYKLISKNDNLFIYIIYNL